MTDNLILLIDRSASVKAYADLYLQTINGIIEAQKYTRPDSTLTCVFFNETIEYSCINFPVKNIDRPLEMSELKPSGLTAFYDNVSAVLHNLHRFHQKNQQKPPVVIVLTDGEDTSSRLINEHQMALKIAMLKAFAWQFVYMGVSENSVRIGRDLGFNTCIQYSCSQASFSRIPEIIAKLLSDRVMPAVDIDISDISDTLSNLKIN